MPKLPQPPKALRPGAPAALRAALAAFALLAGVAGVAALALPQPAQAHGPQAHAAKAAAPVRKEQKPWGIAADAKAVRRTFAIEMSDAMRYTPAAISVRQGETVRLAVTNRGKVLHELVLGTRAELEEHAKLMLKFPEMEHDEPWMAHVSPGKTVNIDWTFNRSGSFHFGCLIPGHFEAGMVGAVEVVPKKRR